MTSNEAFQQNLAFGQVAESRIARWIRGRGQAVLPVYDIEYETGKGPRLFLGVDTKLVAPDLAVFARGRVIWVEVKHKTAFSWGYTRRRWETGIDLHHYEDYLRVMDETELPVWLLFLHPQSKPSADDQRHNCPPECPVGLFGGSLEYLLENESHRHANHGPSGMVYWREETFHRPGGETLFVPIEDVPE